LIDTVNSARFEQIDIGQQFFTSESFGFQAMDAFAELSGDRSAIHTHSETARDCGFPDRLQYGFLLASLLSRIVGSNFHRAVCAAVSLDFMKPVPAQARVEVTAKVTQVQRAMRSVVLAITMNSEQTTVVRGKLTIVFLATD
jgi:3-hydroxybutyryl-CoA dehydratase